MLSRKNSLLCRLATAMAPGSPKSASTVNSAVYTTWSPLAPLFWHQSLMDTRPLCIGFLVPGKIVHHHHQQQLSQSWESRQGKSNLETSPS
uniref:Uncharacterized protein n=1 Tax=Oryza meridionalis TaxID=40149 RepID=A0A0E0CW58_9ORYZ